MKYDCMSPAQRNSYLILPNQQTRADIFTCEHKISCISTQCLNNKLMLKSPKILKEMTLKTVVISNTKTRIEFELSKKN